MQLFIWKFHMYPYSYVPISLNPAPYWNRVAIVGHYDMVFSLLCAHRLLR